MQCDLASTVNLITCHSGGQAALRTLARDNKQGKLPSESLECWTNTKKMFRVMLMEFHYVSALHRVSSQWKYFYSNLPATWCAGTSQAGCPFVDSV
jgi:hypothetical protein